MSAGAFFLFGLARQGSNVVAVDAGGHCLDIFLSHLSLSLSLTTETTARYRLRERPVKPKIVKPNHQTIISLDSYVVY